jgi:hypothetical protein
VAPSAPTRGAADVAAKVGAKPPEPAAAGTVPAPESAVMPSQGSAELERFKGALKALVRQGVMNRDEARAAWQARLASLGLQG